MQWSNNTISEFITLYKSYPVIWNPKHELHKNRNVVAEAWDNIRNEISIDISVADLKRKKEALMTTYRSIKRRIKDSEKSCAGQGDIYKPTWFAFKELNDFLHNIGKVNLSLDADEIDTEYTLIDSGDDSEGNGLTFEEQIENNITEQSNNIKQELEEHIVGIKNVKKTCTSSKIIQNKRTRETFDDEIEKYVKKKASSVKSVSSRFAYHEEEEDNCSLYGRLLVSKLRAFAPRKREIIMNQIDNLIFSAQMDDSDFDFDSLNVYHHPTTSYVPCQLPSLTPRPLSPATQSPSPYQSPLSDYISSPSPVHIASLPS